MTAITREYLHALELQALDRPHYVNPREVRDLAAALRRVLDVRDDALDSGSLAVGLIARLDAALAGTQTDDGAGDARPTTPDEPGPSSPANRAHALRHGFHHAGMVEARIPTQAECLAAIAALDAYDREHADMCRHESMHGDNTDPLAVQTWTCDSCGHWVYCQPDRSLAARVEADLRERIAADIEAMTLGQIGMHVSLFDAARDRAARIARGGQS